MPEKVIPDIVVGRLPIYLRELQRMLEENRRVTSSQELGERLGISAAQIRKDLSYQDLITHTIWKIPYMYGDPFLLQLKFQGGNDAHHRRAVEEKRKIRTMKQHSNGGGNLPPILSEVFVRIFTYPRPPPQLFPPFLGFGAPAGKSQSTTSTCVRFLFCARECHHRFEDRFRIDDDHEHLITALS